jgi:hypothetical protein
MNALRYFALVLGLVYVLAGILGFVPGVVTPPATDTVPPTDGRLLGLFPINALHNIVHLAIGAWGVYAFSSTGAARGFARGIAIIYGVFTIMGVIPVLNTVFGLVPLYGHNVWLHALSALAGAYFGWFHRAAAAPTAATGQAYAGSRPRDEL